MLIGRKKELADLKELEKKTGIRILVLYGQKGIGKTTLLKNFLEGKNGLYYEAVSCSFRQQKSFFISHLNDMGIYIPETSEFEDIFSSIVENGKKIWVIDEFQHMCKADMAFLEEVSYYFSAKDKEIDLLLILSTSSVGWVESFIEGKLKEYFVLEKDKNLNERMTATGSETDLEKFRTKEFEESRLTENIEFEVREIERSQFAESMKFTRRISCEKIKLEELKYYDFKEMFPLFSFKDSIGAFSILGGNPGLWQKFNDKYTLRENIEQFILQREEKLFEYGQQYVEEELRETAVYNTILKVLADGKCKLNEIYQATGFSRAKISVYLKNLIQLKVVEKVVSVDTEGRENAQKGVYRISNSYLHFYYKYIFGNQNLIGFWNKENIYEEKIASTLADFTENGFKKVCLEFLERENTLGRLPEKFSYLGEWIGKEGKIDFIFINEDKEVLAGICNWKQEMMQYEDYERFMKCQENAKIEAEYVVLFSAGNFDNRLRQEAKKNPYIALVSAKQM